MFHISQSNSPQIQSSQIQSSHQTIPGEKHGTWNIFQGSSELITTVSCY